MIPAEAPRDWWRSLAAAPAPMARVERRALGIATLLVAVTRFLALAKTPWDWDEMLFSLALRHFNVAEHHPHPPGFPLFVGLAKLLTLAGLTPFRALQAIDFAAAVMLLPAMCWLCRELRIGFRVSFAASLLLAFFPNVWFYGGTGFSDVPSMLLSIVAIALLLRGCRDDRAYVGGAIVLAVAAGFRPQNLMIGWIPALIATSFVLRRSVMRVVLAALLGAAIVGGSYAAAAQLTGWDDYRYALQKHRQYIAAVDSFRSPIRPPLLQVVDDFFVRPYRQPLINIVITLLVLVSATMAVLRRRAPLLVASLIFGPFAVAAWLLLDFWSASRFSLGYMPLYALLAADGLALVCTRAGARAYAIACAALVVLLAGWSAPAIARVHDTTTPPVAAMEWIRANVPREDGIVYVHRSMGPYADWFLADYATELVDAAPRVAWRARESAYVQEFALRGARLFAWPHDRLYAMARPRYFDVSVATLPHISFGDGWYDEEGSGDSAWRWMGATSAATLPPLGGRTALTLSFAVPLDALPSPPTVTIAINERVVDRVVCTRSAVTRSYDAVDLTGGATLRITTNAVAHVANDGRALGLRLTDLTVR